MEERRLWMPGEGGGESDILTQIKLASEGEGFREVYA